MNRLILSLLLLFSASLSQAIECTGVHQSFDGNGESVVQTQKLAVTIEDAATKRLATDIGDVHYFVQENKDSKEFLLMVTLGPDYSKGVTMATTWNEQNDMRVVRVDGDKIYKIICTK